MNVAWMSVWLLSSLTTAFTANDHDVANYTGCQLLSVQPETSEENGFLITLYKADVPGVEFWEGPTNVSRPVAVQLCPTVDQSLRDQLTNISHTVQIPDIQTVIDEQAAENELLGRFEPSTGKIEFALDQYHTFAEIQSYLEMTSRQYPDIISTEQVGSTIHGNPLHVVKVSDSTSNRTKPIIWLDSGIHAREWVTVASAMYLIEQMATSNSTLIKGLLRDFDWYIMPVANPDGYIHTWTKNRLWRKNLSSNGPLCSGVDLNRNFEVDFKGGGLLTNFVCSQEYKGPSAFSEKETQAMKAYLTPIKSQIKAFISLHSYGQMWLHPYGYQSTKARDYQAMNRVAQLAVAAMREVSGTHYVAGTIYDQLYHVSGSSVDWAYEALGVKYSYAVEQRDRGVYGFLLPRSQIIPTVKELLAALDVIVVNANKDIRQTQN